MADAYEKLVNTDIDALIESLYEAAKAPERLSLAQQVALLPPDEQEAFFAELNDADLAALEYDFKFWGRPAQFEPPGDWDIWLVVAGRGFGKTRTGAEWVRKKALENPGCRIALVGRTTSDVQRVMIYGESGIMAVHAPDERPEHKISKGRLEWANGSIAETFSSEAPSQLRGPMADFAWGDEHAAWLHTTDDSGLNAWDNLRIMTRLGAHPQILATTTPKKLPALVELFEEAEANPGTIAITRGSTLDNISNLPESYIRSVLAKYQHTNIGLQELAGLMLDDDTDGQWNQEMIDAKRWLADSPWRQLPIRCVALDPSVAEEPKDEAGIVVVGATGGRDLHRRHAYVLEDATVMGSPDVWAAKAVEMARKYRCPIVAEGNQGQALVSRVIKSIDPTIKVYLVQASQGKKTRAEPCVLPYQQGRVHHVGHMPDLELQMTTFDPAVSKKSPDRMDALVWGITATLIDPPKGFGSGAITASTKTRGRRLPSGRGAGRTFRDGTTR